MKTLRWVFLWLLFCVLLAQAIPTFVDRSEFAHAVAAYAKDPSPANTKELARQQRINQSIRVRMELLGICALFAAGMLCYGAYRTAFRAFQRRRITL
jgi:hypothetical protein